MLVFAHRGDSSNFPENTLAAFNSAIQKGADGIELDVFTVENQLVVIHDQQVNRTTNGTGCIEEYSLTELAKLDAGQGESIPLLTDVIPLVPPDTLLNVELKGHNTLSPLLALIASGLLSQHIANKTLLISSFHHHLLKQFNAIHPDINTGALTASIPLDYAAFATQLNSHSLHVDRAFVDQPFIDDAHRRGLKVFVYTVDQPEEIKYLKHMGADGIFANDPLQALQVIASLS